MTKREKILCGIIGVLLVIVLVTSDRIITENDGNIISVGFLYKKI